MTFHRLLQTFGGMNKNLTIDYPDFKSSKYIIAKDLTASNSANLGFVESSESTAIVYSLDLYFEKELEEGIYVMTVLEVIIKNYSW